MTVVHQILVPKIQFYYMLPVAFVQFQLHQIRNPHRIEFAQLLQCVDKFYEPEWLTLHFTIVLYHESEVVIISPPTLWWVLQLLVVFVEFVHVPFECGTERTFRNWELVPFTVTIFCYYIAFEQGEGPNNERFFSDVYLAMKDDLHEVHEEWHPLENDQYPLHTRDNTPLNKASSHPKCLALL